MRRIALIATASAACRAAPAPHASSEPTLVGSVVSADGRGVRATIVVIDREQQELVAIMNTDAQGRFALSYEPSAVTIAATSADGYAYLEFLPATSPTTVELSADCHRTSGKLERLDGKTFTAATKVALARNSANVGDMFAYEVAPDGSWQGCLPPANYRVLVDDVIAGGGGMHRVPGPAAVIRTTTEAAAKASPPAPPPHTDRSTFLRTLADDVTVLALAESNHGTAEYVAVRTDMALELRDHGFTWIGLEASFGDVLAADAYAGGDDVELGRAVHDLAFFMYATKEMADALRRMRAANEGRAPAKRIRLFGFDVQRAELAIDALLTSTQVPDDVRALLDAMRKDADAAWKSAAAPSKAAFHRALDAMQIAPGAGVDANRTALAARMLRWRIALTESIGGGGFDARLVRERGMADMVAAMRECDPEIRIMLWGHLGHLGKEYYAHEETMGALLGRDVGRGYRVVGLLTQRGEVLARSGNAAALATFELEPPVPYSVEAALGGELADDEVGYVSLNTLEGDTATWIAGLRYVRELGAFFLGNDKHWTPLDVTRAFDALAIFGRTHATHGYAEAKAKP
jgi:erythromycin esterase-like protein